MKTFTKLILALIIFIVIGILVYQIYSSNNPCWPFCSESQTEETDSPYKPDQTNTIGTTTSEEGEIDIDLTEEERMEIEQNLIKAGCPDEMIVNKMPGVGNNQPESYYVKDGKRVEVSEYSPIWVKANCEVPVTEVF